jgi:hypothetical protein
MDLSADGQDLKQILDTMPRTITSTATPRLRPWLPATRNQELDVSDDLVYTDDLGCTNVFDADSILEFGRDGMVRKIIDLADMLMQRERDCLGQDISRRISECL